MRRKIEGRWTRLSLADAWDCSDRKVDRMRKDGRLGEPIGYVGRSPIWSDEQREAAERAGLQAHHEAKATARPRMGRPTAVNHDAA